jgi:predicted alpha/beta hydrolase
MSTRDLTTVTLERADGSVADVLCARADAPTCGVLVLPALGIGAAYYTPLLEALRVRGVTAAVLGAPRWPDDRKAARPPVYGYADLAVDLVPQALARLDVSRDARFLVGHSLGGAVAGIHTGRTQDVAGIALVAAGTPYHRAYRGGAWVRTYFGTQLIGAVAKGFGFFPGDRLGFGGRMSGKLAREWASLARTGQLVVTHPANVDAEAAFGDVRCPVVAVVLPGDALAPTAAVRHLVAKFGTSASSVHVYAPPAGHVAPDHNRWPRDPEPFAEIIEAFASSVLAGRETVLPHVVAA